MPTPRRRARRHRARTADLPEDFADGFVDYYRPGFPAGQRGAIAALVALYASGDYPANPSHCFTCAYRADDRRAVVAAVAETYS